MTATPCHWCPGLTTRHSGICAYCEHNLTNDMHESRELRGGRWTTGPDLIARYTKENH